MKPTRMLRILCALALVAALLAAVGCDETTTASSEAAASQKADTSSVESAEVLPETDERGYILVNNVRLNRNIPISEDVSALFDKSAPGYVVEGDSRPLKVDAETLKRLITANVEGTGSVQWIDYGEMRTTSQRDTFDGTVPVSKLRDPLFMSTCLPSEANTFMTGRNNAENMYPSNAKYTNIMTIGGIYRNEDNPPADSDTVTVCIGSIRLALHTAEKGWFLADEQIVPVTDMVKHLYYLPWGNGKKAIPSSCLSKTNDHIEITLTGADFNAKNAPNDKIKAALLHFWGGAYTAEKLGESFDKIDGMAASYTAWIKEPNMVGHFVGTIGADWRTTIGGSTDQAFSGYNYLLSTEPRIVFGHNVGPAAYDTVMDSAKVQSLLGLK